jgi:N-acetylglucosamine kinase-like BadF-type ATPase
MEWIIGVDGGGTKTDFLLATDEGQVVARRIEPASNIQNLGNEKCEEVLRNGIEGLCNQAGISIKDVSYTCLGLGGLDTEQDLQAYQSIVIKIFGIHTKRVALENDCFIAIYSGTLGKPGMALVSGTGSMAIGVNEKGEQARSGGWGYLFGDEGSAFDIGRHGAIAALKAKDGRGPWTELVGALEAEFGMDLFDAAIDQYRNPTPQTKIASLARIVDTVAQKGDRIALKIIKDGAEELADAALAVVKQLKFTSSPIPVSLTGGTFNSPIMMEELRSALKQSEYSFDLIRPVLPPIAGSYILALLKLHKPVDDSVLAKLKEGLLKK